MNMYVLQSQLHIIHDMVIVSSMLLKPLPVSKLKNILEVHKSVLLQIQLSRYTVQSGRRSYMCLTQIKGRM